MMKMTFDEAKGRPFSKDPKFALVQIRVGSRGNFQTHERWKRAAGINVSFSLLLPSFFSLSLYRFDCNGSSCR